MISAMRRQLKLLGILLWVVIAAFVGTTFFVWGKGSITGGNVDAVATVNGEDIPLDRYQRRYQAYLDFYRQVYRDRLTAEMTERLGLSRQALDDLVRETLVVQWAEGQGLAVGDDELRLRVQALRPFQEQGRFSRARYLEVLKANRRDAATFEADMRRELTQRKVEDTIKAGVKVSEAELLRAYETRHEKVRATWALVELSSFLAGAQASDDEIQAYLKEHPGEFARPERRRVQYAMVASRAFPRKVTDAEVEAYYKERASEFERPRRVRAAHILVRVPEVGGSEAEGRAKARAEELIRRARAGEDFARLAKENSEDPGSAANGGDLGFVGPGEMVPAFEQALFALKKGDIAPQAVRTPFGYHAIKAVEVQEGGKRPLREVAGEIRAKLVTAGSDRAAQVKAEEAARALQTAKEFAAEARKLGLDPREATLGRGDPLEGAGPDPNVQEALFSLAVGGTSSPLRIAAGYVILRVIEHLPAGVPPLAEIKDQIAAAVKRQKAEGPAMERARALAAAAARGEDLVALAKKEGLQAGDSGLLARSDPIPSAIPAEALRSAFETPVGRIGEPVKTGRGIYLVKTLERQPPDPARFDKERADLEKQVLGQKQAEAWESWLAGLRGRAQIQMASQTR